MNPESIVLCANNCQTGCAGDYAPQAVWAVWHLNIGERIRLDTPRVIG
ncbi:hypothetical protein N9381_04800 [Paracoccaceae bacterium]|jgi:hypothetical protein|nr:hypothetical protein [Paracoccaceae bacterium]